MERDDPTSNSALSTMLLVPMAIISFACLLISWFVARAGFRYNLVKLSLWPAVFMISNALMFCCMIPVFFFLTIKTGGNFLFVSDLTLWESLFMPLLTGFWYIFLPLTSTMPEWSINPNGTNPAWIVLYQFLVWLCFGRWIMRNLALAIYDAATVKIAMAAHTDVNEFRIGRAKNDPSYVKAAMFYESRGKVPPWSIITVEFAGGLGTAPYYFDY